MKKCLAAATMFLCVCSPVSVAEFYVGTGIGYQVIDVDQIDSLSIVPNARFEPPLSLVDEELPDLYSDEFLGIKIISGYKLRSSLSVEAGYFNSWRESYDESTDIRIVDSAKAEIDVESFSIDILGHYQLTSLGSLSLLASVGLIYQETKITREYQVFVLCLIEDNLGCNGRRKELDKENAYDLRLQLGMGIQYDVSDNLGLRTMMKVVPDGFSVGEDFPYTISAGLLYSF